jgi:predicted nucleotidyltransferase
MSTGELLSNQQDLCRTLCDCLPGGNVYPGNVVGGSHTKGTADADSDLDLTTIVQEEALERN